MSDFSLHSIGIILSKFEKLSTYKKIIIDLFVNGQIEILSLEPEDLILLIKNMERFNLDFDDSYQLTIAQKYEMTIISFDKDFNVEGINKKTPEEVLSQND